MSNPFLGQITVVAFNFAPPGYAFCNGQILSINQNQSLFALLGTIYGGDGESTFALPDLRGRTPVHTGSVQGQKGGTENVTLSAAQMPTHSHVPQATNDAATTDDSTGNVLAQVGGNLYRTPAALTPMGSEMVAMTGGGQSHNNMQPYRVISFAIALAGVFPSEN